MSLNVRNKFYVYMAWHPVSNEPIYVGKGCRNRHKTHNYLARKKRHYNRMIARHVEQYGPMIFEIIREGLSDAEAISTEISLIHHFGRVDTGSGTLLNLTDGGEGVSGPKTPEWCANISAALKGKIRSAEHSANISFAKKGHPSHQNQKAAVSARLKGVPKTAEHNAKNSASNKGKKRSPETCARVSAAKLAYFAAKRANIELPLLTEI